MNNKNILNNEESLNEFFEKNKNILSALKFAKKAHEGQLRKSGEEFIMHPINVATKLWLKYRNETLTVAALLHDTVEDVEEISIKQIYEEFGSKVGFIVDALNKREYSFYEYSNMEFQDKLSRFLWAGLKDIRVFLVKIADREHNLETLENLKENKQVRMAFETQAVFEPLKQILGYDRNISLTEVKNNFTSFLKERKIKYDKNKFADLKKTLYEDAFNNFDEESFKLVYENAAVVVWQIEGWEMFDKLCNSKTFENKIELLEVKSDGNKVIADFKFKEGVVFENKDKLKLQISTYSDK